MPDSFYTKVVGVAFQNLDGTDRQKILRKCRIGEQLALRREYDNPKDPDAIGVYRLNGEKIGHISSDIVSSGPLQNGLAEAMDMGCKAYAEIKDITGGQSDKPTFGCNIIIYRDYEPPYAIESGIGYKCETEAKDLEKTDPKHSTERYYKAIKHLDKSRAMFLKTKYVELNPSAVSYYGKYPINRLTLLL